MKPSQEADRPTDPDFIGADAALRRAARRALQAALQLGTPCWVMEGGKLIDLAARHRAEQSGAEHSSPTDH